MGEGEEEIRDIIQIFFITIQICLSWRVTGLESDRSADICVP